MGISDEYVFLNPESTYRNTYSSQMGISDEYVLILDCVSVHYLLSSR